jgi:hypothetical protein
VLLYLTSVAFSDHFLVLLYRHFRLLIAGKMHSIINVVELENRVISATYRNLMIKAKIVAGRQGGRGPFGDPDPVTTISSPAPSDALLIRLPDSVSPGFYFLEAHNAHDHGVARSVEFRIG